MIIIYGPTGVGKTALSYQLASIADSAIINMDIGSLYEPLTIGTAKPDWKQSEYPHYLFDTIKEPAHYTVTQYRSDVQQVLNELKQHNSIPICVGGSGFYLKSLLFPPQQPEIVTSIAPNDISDYTDVPTDQLWHQLKKIDPARAQAIHINDRYRIMRALTIWHTSGQLPSSLTSTHQPVTNSRIIIIHLYRERDELYRIINERVRHMMLSGWIEEVQQLLDTPWEQFLCDKKIIGYDDIITYLRTSSLSYEELVDSISQKSRHYAKRQMTYWRMLKQLLHEHASNVSIHEINASDVDIASYIKQFITNEYPYLRLDQAGPTL